MKLKKESIILAVIIAALIAYILMRNRDRTNYELPDIKEIPVAEITGIDIAGPQGVISLTKTKDKWTVSPQGYPADASAVSAMVEIISRPDVITMVSESKNFARYGLEDDKKIHVKAKGASLREFDIGDTTDDRRHTFIRFSDNDNVYHSVKDFRTAFQKTAEQLRDKVVLSFDKKEITVIRISGGSNEINLTLKQGTKQAKGEGTTETSDSRWEDLNGKSADNAEMEGLLSVLSNLSCSGYLSDSYMENLTGPVCRVILSGKREYRISIFAGPDSRTYYATSSENASPFILKETDAATILAPGEGTSRKVEE